jgi:membrane protein YqaA with SNARE-associated domain
MARSSDDPILLMTEKILTILFVFISSLVAATGYAGIVLLMAIESACIPLPSELIMPFAGYLVYTGAMKLVWAATAGAIGCNLGSLVAYEIGCYGGRPLVERYGRWILMGRRELDWADRFFDRWGDMAVFIARLLPVDPHLHRAARRSRPHAARQVPHLHVSGIVALVSCAGLLRHEAGRKLALARQVLPQIRCGHRSRSADWDRVVPVVALAEPVAGERGVGEAGLVPMRCV